MSKQVKLSKGAPDSVELKDQANDAMAQRLPRRRKLVSGAGYHNFETDPIFEGTYISPVISEKDPDKVIGFLFISSDGEEKIVGNSHAIAKALNQSFAEGLDRPYLVITFRGKVTLKDGKPFNRFDVELIED